MMFGGSAQRVEVREDRVGLYVGCGGVVLRPFFGTSFFEGEWVMARPMPGRLGGVTTAGKPGSHHFGRGGRFEYWSATGISYEDYLGRVYPDRQVEEMARLHGRHHNRMLGGRLTLHNSRFER